MFGLVAGMAIFSTISAYGAKKALEELQLKQAKRAQIQAEDTVKALEFAALTETHATYSEEFDMNRAQANMARATGKTRGGQEYILNAQESEGETFGTVNTKVAITASDDTLLRAKVYQLGNAEDMEGLADNPNRPVAVFDASAVRDRQVRTSHKAMEGLAEQVYAFYAGNMRFPSDAEFRELQAKFPYVDAWGGQFDYTRIGDEKGKLEFTTPWNYTQTLNLGLNE